MSKLSRQKPRGFTLLEVLLALAIVSLALMALMRAASLAAHAQAHQRDVTVAQWVAQNVMAKTALENTQPTVGEREGRMPMAERNWHWKMVVQSTEEVAVRRLDIHVFAEQNDGLVAADASPIFSLVGFSGPR